MSGPRSTGPAASRDTPAEVSALRPFVAETAAAGIADRFVTAIALGEFAVGQKLPTVKELAQLLVVSPGTVRDALGRLSALGYVNISRGRAGGTVVVSQWGPASDSMVRRALDEGWEQLEVTLDCRSIIEQQIARTAAQRIVAADVPRVMAAVHGYEQAGAERESSGTADLEVHQSIAAAAHNPQLTALSLRMRREVSFGFDAEPYTPEVRATAIRQHAALAAAVIEGEPERAAELAAQHFRLTEQTLRDLHARISADQPTRIPRSKV